MKKNILKSLLILVTITLSSCGGNKPTPTPSFDDAPDYSKSTKQMSMYAYAAPGDGIYTIDGKKYQITGENGKPVTFQTVEMFNEYKACGFDIIMFQADDAYRGETFETSHIKNLLDLAKTCGLKAIIFDKRIHDLSQSISDLLGYTITDPSKGQFVNQDELNTYVADCMKDYGQHEAFYGVMLRDEPTYEMLPAVGEMYKAVKATNANYFAQCNLLPLSNADATRYKKGATAETVLEAYDWYVNEFVTQTASNYLMFDSYPMQVNADNENDYLIKIEHLKGMQIVAETCEKRNLEYYMVIQSCSWRNNGSRKTRAVLEEDLKWQWNLCLGLGVDQISYFTYQRRRTNVTAGEYFDDGTSFITSDGTKTPIYYWAKQGHVGVHALAKIMMNFKYQGLCTFANGDYAKCSIKFLSGVKDAEDFKWLNPNKITYTKEGVLLISEMYDAAKNQYGYMVMNCADPSCDVTMETTLSIKEGIKALNMTDDNGVITNGAVTDGKYTLTLAPGRGVFVMPF